MDERIRRLINWSKNIKESPFEVHIHLTNKCNLKCTFCNRPKRNRIKEIGLSTEKWVAIVKEASKLGVKHWDILGGEPFIESKKVILIMKTIKKERMSGLTFTNGTLITKETIEKLVNIGWDELFFSLDGAIPTTHDNLREKEGTFEKCTNTIKMFNYYKKLMGKNKPVLQLFFVITNKNYKELPLFIKLAKDLEIKDTVFQAMIQTSRQSKKLALSKQEQEEFKLYAKRTQKIAEREGVTTNVHSFFDCDLIDKANNAKPILKKDWLNKSYPICYEPWQLIKISAEGYVNPCCSLHSKKMNVKQKSLKAVWHSSFFEGFRRKIRSGRLDKKCSTCCSGQILKNKMLREKLENMLSNKFFKKHTNSTFKRVSKPI